MERDRRRAVKMECGADAPPRHSYRGLSLSPLPRPIAKRRALQ